MKKILSIILLSVLTCAAATMAMSAAVTEPENAVTKPSSEIMIGSFPSGLCWRGQIYMSGGSSKMVLLEDLEKDYHVVAEIEAVVEDDEFFPVPPQPSADNKAIANFGEVGEKIYQRDNDNKIYLRDKSKPFPDFATRTWLYSMEVREDVTLAAGVEDPIP